ncbi:MAG: transposase [Bacteroidales bacterium]|nr:transposase [Bacteroidales bacterium]
MKSAKAVIETICEIEIDGNVYALDSTSIDLCLTIFWRAEFQKREAGIKLHTLYDVKTTIPTFLHVSKASVHDVNILDMYYPIRSWQFLCR